MVQYRNCIRNTKEIHILTSFTGFHQSSIIHSIIRHQSSFTLFTIINHRSFITTLHVSQLYHFRNIFDHFLINLSIMNIFLSFMFFIRHLFIFMIHRYSKFALYHSQPIHNHILSTSFIIIDQFIIVIHYYLNHSIIIHMLFINFNHDIHSFMKTHLYDHHSLSTFLVIHCLSFNFSSINHHSTTYYFHSSYLVIKFIQNQRVIIAILIKKLYFIIHFMIFIHPFTHRSFITHFLNHHIIHNHYL